MKLHKESPWNGAIRNPIATSRSSVVGEPESFDCCKKLVYSHYSVLVMESVMSIKIGQLAKRTETTVETIRFYEQEGMLIQPYRSEGNYRLYGDKHYEALRFIVHCRYPHIALDEDSNRLLYRTSHVEY